MQPTCCAPLPDVNERAAELRYLQWNWGEAYLITGASGHWLAQRRDNGRLLVASWPRDLRELIIDDYTVQPVPREYGAEAAA